VRGGGVLLSLLVLPLYIPVLIFGAGAVDATVKAAGAWRFAGPPVAAGRPPRWAACFFAPWPTAAALRIALE
jgi:heme exporter protein B